MLSIRRVPGTVSGMKRARNIAPASDDSRPRRRPRARVRRNAEEARTAILNAAEARLIEDGPAGIRLQAIAADVGISHPAVLHHFGSREALVEAVVARALASLDADLLAALGKADHGEAGLATLLDR